METQRAFFVHPAWERRGLGRALLETGEAPMPGGLTIAMVRMIKSLT